MCVCQRSSRNELLTPSAGSFTQIHAGVLTLERQSSYLRGRRFVYEEFYQLSMCDDGLAVQPPLVEQPAAQQNATLTINPTRCDCASLADGITSSKLRYIGTCEGQRAPREDAARNDRKRFARAHSKVHYRIRGLQWK
jgi:hypothetical protein